MYTPEALMDATLRQLRDLGNTLIVVLSPPTVTARTSFFSRFPWQQAQGVALMQLSISSFWAWLELSR